MKLIRCLSCNKVLGEVEGKARIKCKMAGCHAMNVIDTYANIQWREPNPIFGIGTIEITEASKS
jgi:LSD1 subclass zinc finger protein